MFLPQGFQGRGFFGLFRNGIEGVDGIDSLLGPILFLE